MEQFLQQVPCAPIAQGDMVMARSKIVSTPSAWAFSIIFTVAESTLHSEGIAVFLGFFTSFSFVSSVAI